MPWCWRIASERWRDIWMFGRCGTKQLPPWLRPPPGSGFLSGILGLDCAAYFRRHTVGAVRSAGAAVQWHSPMTYKARIYLRLAPAETRYHYIGEIDLNRRPVEKGQIPFKRQGKVQLGSIETVSPRDWDKRGVIPVLHVVLESHEIPEEKPRQRERRRG